MLPDHWCLILALLFLLLAVVLAIRLWRLRKREKAARQTIAEMKERVFTDMAEDYLNVAEVSVPVEYTANWKSGDIVSLVSMACRSCEALAGEKKIRLVYDLKNVVEMYYIPFYTQRIVQELVTNAINFSPARSDVLISTRLKDTMIQIFVSDKGIGMTAKQKARIFEPFYRAAGQDAYGGGLGVGLPMVKLAVNAMEGHVEVYSFPDLGSTFIVNIPVKNRSQLVLTPERERQLSSAEQAFVKRFTHLVQQSMEAGNKIDYDEIAGQMSISRTHLNRKLKAITGQTTSECVLHIRMSIAKRLLDGTDIPIGDVAFQCGMDNFTYFSSLFKKTIGMTPSQYKNRDKH